MGKNVSQGFAVLTIVRAAMRKLMFHFTAKKKVKT